MVRLARPALTVSLIAACASGADDLTNPSGFGSAPSVPSAASQSSAPGTDPGTDGMSSTGDVTGRPTEPATTDRPTEPYTTDDPGDTDTDPGPDTTVSTTDAVTTDDSTTGPVVLCGNGTIDAAEECDGAELGGKTCITFGFTGGALVCSPQCIFDKAMCTSPSCGDGTVDPGEECDCGQQGVNCTAAQIANSACTSLASPNGNNYAGGTLSCNSPMSCSFNKSACTFCGDGVRNNAEACDGGDLGGQSCNSLGFTGGGNLSCNGDCSHNTGGCMNIVCGNGQCQAGEDSCSCPADCPDDPSSCSSCECGLQGGPQCYCDPQCISYGDCCAGGPC